MSWCSDESEHRRQAQDDYRRGGRYGYDREEYRNPWNDCSDAYTREFDRLCHDEERRQEERREEERREHQRWEAREQARMEEEAYYEQSYQQQYPEPECIPNSLNPRHMEDLCRPEPHDDSSP